MSSTNKDQFDKSSENSENQKSGMGNREHSANETDNVSPSRGEVRGEPGIRRAGSDTAATGSGLRPKLGVTGSDLDGQVTDQ